MGRRPIWLPAFVSRERGGSAKMCEPQAASWRQTSCRSVKTRHAIAMCEHVEHFLATTQTTLPILLMMANHSFGSAVEMFLAIAAPAFGTCSQRRMVTTVRHKITDNHFTLLSHWTPRQNENRSAYRKVYTRYRRTRNLCRKASKIANLCGAQCPRLCANYFDYAQVRLQLASLRKMDSCPRGNQRYPLWRAQACR